MKISKRLILILSFVFVYSLPKVSCALAADAKFAYIDVEKIFDEYEKTKKFDQDLQQQGKAKQEKRDAIVNDIRRLKDEQALLSEDKKKEKQADIENRLKELDAFDEAAKKELGEKRNGIMKEILNDIDGVLRQYGQRKGFDFIFNERALLYKNSKYDQTPEVLKELNEAYRKQKK